MACAVTLVVAARVADAQTIHRDDLDYLVAAFAVKDSLGERYVDCSKLVRWMSLEPEPGGKRRNFSGITYSRDTHWVYAAEPLSEQNDGMRSSHLFPPDLWRLRFYVMMDFFGHELQKNVLTVWQLVGNDSLRYHCGQVGSFNTHIGGAKAKIVKIFPDTSFLVAVALGGEGYGGHDFFRGRTPCNLERFFGMRYYWDESDRNFEYVIFDFTFLMGRSYQITEVTQYITIDPRPGPYDPPGGPRYIIDSAKVNVVDLWELAKAHFGVDTSGFSYEIRE